MPGVLVVMAGTAGPRAFPPLMPPPKPPRPERGGVLVEAALVWAFATSAATTQHMTEIITVIIAILFMVWRRRMMSSISAVSPRHRIFGRALDGKRASGRMSRNFLLMSHRVKSRPI